MFNFIVKRIFQTIPVLIGVTIVIFLIMQMVPGDPAVLLAGESATEEQVQQLRNQLGLNDPLYIQYFDYIKNVFQGDLGTSIRSNRPVIDEIMVRLPVTIELAFWSIVVTIVLGLLAGVIAATNQRSFKDVGIMIVALIGVSLPNFWLGLMLILFLSVQFQIFPVAGWGSFAHIVLPAITLGTSGAAIVARMTRSS